MKKFVFAVVMLIALSSCGNKDVIAPAVADAGKVFYKDANVSIADVKGVPVGSNVKFQFSSLYEKEVVKMELMSGPYENMLCFIHEETIQGNSHQKKSYTFTEANANTGDRFYVIKYTLKSGGWVLTPTFKYEK